MKTISITNTYPMMWLVRQSLIQAFDILINNYVVFSYEQYEIAKRIGILKESKQHIII